MVIDIPMAVKKYKKNLTINFKIRFLLLIIYCLLLAGCKEGRLRLATTTSFDNSGLLKVILAEFEKEKKIKTDVIAVGTGAALLRLGRNGNCDILITHSMPDEEEFIKDGFGIDRREIMWNDFVLLGPKNDPAKVKDKDLMLGLKNIVENQALFVSRGDESETHKKEKDLWEKIRIKPSGKWYLETRQGMGQALMIANENNAYCLCDRGTYQ
ncbi:TPA: tungsten ABC transporter substrate-binding protein, partial [bacterium]|nr:tungsten ABC transporter substrate-binding protein [bacterium]